MSDGFSNRVRLYPTPEQAALFEQNFGACRWLYNYMLALHTSSYETTGKAPSCNAMMSMLPELKKTHEWLRIVDSTSLQQVIRRNLASAFKRFFAKIEAYPVFKCKGKSRDSFLVTMSIETNGDMLRIGKHGWVRCRGLRAETRCSRIISVSVFREAGNYYASVFTDHVHSTDIIYPTYEACGIDIGVAKPITLARDATAVVMGCRTQAKLKRIEKRRKKYQRKLARQQRGTKAKPESKSRKHTKQKIAKMHQCSRFILEDFQHKKSTQIVREHRAVILEDLRIQNMTRSASGTIEAPGRNVKSKSGLNREMLRMAPSRFAHMLEYKCRRYGRGFARVNPAYTSQTCHVCGTLDKNNRKSQAIYSCDCGYTGNADVNAARNILRIGLATLS